MKLAKIQLKFGEKEKPKDTLGTPQSQTKLAYARGQILDPFNWSAKIAFKNEYALGLSVGQVLL